jgi:DNA polymerase-3 subunit alpha
LSREIFSLDTARERYAKYLKIRLSPKFDVAQLAPLLKEYRKDGCCRVAIDYWRADVKASLNLSDAWLVRPTDSLLNSLREVFSKENVEMVY